MTRYKIYHQRSDDRPLSVQYHRTVHEAWGAAYQMVKERYFFVKLWDGETPLARYATDGTACFGW